LEDDGIFVFDVMGKEEIKKQTQERSWYISNGGDFWSKDPYFLLEETKIFENKNTIERRYYLINQADGKIKEFIMLDQYYDENSIKTLLSENGFEIIKVNRDLMKYREETLFIIAKKNG
jgi:hypothetical protein